MKISGINSISEALKSGVVNRIYVDKNFRNPRIKGIIDAARKRGIPVIYAKNLPRDSKGIVADVSPIRYVDFNNLIEKCLRLNSFLLFFDSVENPGDMGSMIRSAEFFGCCGVVIPKRRCVQISDSVAKSSAGAVLHVDVSRVENMASALKKVKKYGISVIGIDLDGDKIENVDMTPPLAIVLGDGGISKPVRKQCDFLARIGGKGKVRGLDLPVVCGIVLFELNRRLVDEG